MATTDYKKIAEEIKSKGFAVEKCDMNDEIPDEWVVFSVWFYLQQNFYVDLDWKTGKYYFYPAYASAAGTPEEIVPTLTDPLLGISAVGKKPIVLATLVDKAGNVVLAGYFKIEIKKEVKTIPSVDIVIKNFS